MKGELLHTIFRNDTEHFSIVKLKIIETNEDYDEKEIVAKGHFPPLQEGMIYTFYGAFETHAKFGKQYRIDAYETYVPDTRDGLVTYLSSDMFYGIGQKTALKIVDTLGNDAINKLLNDESLIKQVPGLKKEIADNLLAVLKENQGFEHVIQRLGKYNIGLKMSQKIYETYKDESLTVVETDPYRFVFDIEGFSFQMADLIAKEAGTSPVDPNRIAAGIIHVLQQSTASGHVYLPKEECSANVDRLLNTDLLTDDALEESYTALDEEALIIQNDEKVYLPTLYYAETGFSTELKRIIEKEIEEETPLAELMAITGDIEETESLSYGEEQFEAINRAIHSKVMILTGGPGTGKTTVIKGIIKAYAQINDLSTDIDDYDSRADYPFILTAPTGRAAKRLTESTGLPAMTIHRLLGWNGQDTFDRNENEPLQGKFIIIDEFSMVDIWLANSLFKAIPSHMQVLLVGDEDQLPSVGPGQVLTDLISSQSIPLVRLKEVYRQKEGSKIIQIAHEIKRQAFTKDSLVNSADFSFIPCTSSQVIEAVTQIFTKAKAKGVDLTDIQVLAPMYRTQSGINEINKKLQMIVNPKARGKREKKYRDVVYRVGDKVIQLVNQPEEGVSNGDIGEIVAIFERDENIDNEEQIVISFDDREVTYTRSDYHNFMHAFCISIHKSQGSEFPIVVLPVVSSYSRMLRKNLLYTAITRGKQSLIICGEEAALLRGVRTHDTNERYSALTNHLEELLGKTSTSEVSDEVEQEKAAEKEPLTPVDDYDISPYDFI